MQDQTRDLDRGAAVIAVNGFLQAPTNMISVVKAEIGMILQRRQCFGTDTNIEQPQV